MKRSIQNLLHRIRMFGYSKTYILFLFFFFTNTFLSVFFSVGLFGTLHIFTNTSDSMLPTINRGSLTIVGKIDTDLYKPGDIISFYTQTGKKQDIITHRIFRRGGNVYITKGDNNEAIDVEPVIPRLIIGKVIIIIPLLGYWVSFIKSKFGIILCIYFPALLILLSEMTHIFFILGKKASPES